jgi:Zn-dependent oligopeptidase
MTVWRPARAQALSEHAALQAIVQAEGGNFDLAPWDWRLLFGEAPQGRIRHPKAR